MKARKIDSRSTAKKAQQKHWETLGQISSMLGLINYILGHNQFLPQKTRQKLSQAHHSLSQAYDTETKNNEFINLNLPKGF